MRDHDTVRIPNPKRPSGAVLLVEDDEQVARELTRVMSSEGYRVVRVDTPPEAVSRMVDDTFDAVVSDVNLPDASGVDLLDVVRAYDPDVPFIVMTGSSTLDPAAESATVGTLDHTVKPATGEDLLDMLDRATERRRVSVSRRETREASRAATDIPGSGEREAMRVTFARALDTLAVTLEPIVDARARCVVAFEARLMSNEETLQTDAVLVAAAEQLGKLQDLRGRTRDLAVKAIADMPPSTALFLDVHPSDLLEGDLYGADPPLARMASRVVLQIRGPVEAATLEELVARVGVLRFNGFRIGIADFGEGQASLSQMAELAPEFLKIDARLVRGVELSAGRQRVVAALVSMGRALGATAIAEGVSTSEQRAALVAAGVELVQGALVLHHGPASKKPSVMR